MRATPSLLPLREGLADATRLPQPRHPDTLALPRDLFFCRVCVLCVWVHRSCP